MENTVWVHTGTVTSWAGEEEVRLSSAPLRSSAHIRAVPGAPARLLARSRTRGWTPPGALRLGPPALAAF